MELDAGSRAVPRYRIQTPPGHCRGLPQLDRMLNNLDMDATLQYATREDVANVLIAVAQLDAKLQREMHALTWRLVMAMLGTGGLLLASLKLL